LKKKKYLSKLAKYKETMSNDKKQPCNNVATLRLWLQVRKRKADGKIPTTKAEMMKLYDLWVDRPVLSLREYLEDLGKEKKDIDDMLDKSTNEMGEQAQSEQEFLPIEQNKNGKSGDSFDNAKLSEEFIWKDLVAKNWHSYVENIPKYIFSTGGIGIASYTQKFGKLVDIRALVQNIR